MDNKKELAAIIKCQNGDFEKFSLLYDGYAEKIYNFIYFKTLHGPTAEDLASETFLKALENIGFFDPDRGKFSSWIYKIAANAVIDHYRTRKQSVGIEDVWDLPADGNDIETDIDARRKLKEVWKYLSEMDAASRDIMIMRLWSGVSYREISEIRGISEAGCRMALSRALRSLRKEISPAAFLLAAILGSLLQK